MKLNSFEEKKFIKKKYIDRISRERDIQEWFESRRQKGLTVLKQIYQGTLDQADFRCLKSHMVEEDDTTRTHLDWGEDEESQNEEWNRSKSIY